MRFLLTIILFLGGYVNSAAQNQKIQVTGVITSQSNKLPILGFSVVYVRDPTSGVNADFDGSYSISLKNGNGILRFSMIGYKPLEVKVNNRSTELSKNVVNEDKISARYENGLQLLTIPKREEVKQKPPTLISIA